MSAFSPLRFRLPLLFLSHWQISCSAHERGLQNMGAVRYEALPPAAHSGGSECGESRISRTACSHLATQARLAHPRDPQMPRSRCCPPGRHLNRPCVDNVAGVAASFPSERQAFQQRPLQHHGGKGGTCVLANCRRHSICIAMHTHTMMLTTSSLKEPP
ncbi:hypothetical protein P154DRAFT_256044 [Amniculicola lignicola CBS 123094]|uniref:Secreted protein n=1 Tax=Amniculicola lignicola CBS 123094 TaxID=1392246 RepID=A0A6A5X0X1_9PLEO|nr:hypothetical protein P154DRAFT_256044 [Amniculicola lignicola CBS 123094]